MSIKERWPVSDWALNKIGLVRYIFHRVGVNFSMVCLL